MNHKKIVKRDGSVEELDLNKLNRWAEWASENCGVIWEDIVEEVLPAINDGVKSVDLQKLLIDACLERKDASHYKMASRLYVGFIYKEVFGDVTPEDFKTFYKRMVRKKLWADLGFSDDQLDILGESLDYKKDFEYDYSTLRQFYDKYSVHHNGVIQETPSLALMGMSMYLMNCELGATDKDTLVKDTIDFYKYLSDLMLNLPTPTLNGARTLLQGSPSCVVVTGEDSINSITALLHVIQVYTAYRSGIGAEVVTRAPLEPVRGGVVAHEGKLGIFKNIKESVRLFTQVTRGGSATVTYKAIDPEIMTLLTLKQQRTSETIRIDALDYSVSFHNLVYKKACLGEDLCLISPYYAPKLYELYDSPDEDAFEEEYYRVISHYNDVPNVITRVPAIQVFHKFFAGRGDTGRNYKQNVTNMNLYTPFKDSIHHSNLCQEIMLPTTAIRSVMDLHDPDGEGEIALCFIAAVVTNALDLPQVDKERMYYLLAKAVDNTIEKSVYPFKLVEAKAKKRRNIGIGLTNLADYMAKHGYKYDDEEGRNAIHRIAEEHSFLLHKASLQLAKERGACEWFHKTKYADGWLPIDQYAAEVDSLHSQPLLCDWEWLRKEISLFGLRFSVHEAHMPCESSSVFSNSTNGLYPIRKNEELKTSRKGGIYFRIKGRDEYPERYQDFYDISMKDHLSWYAIVQKFTGQGISLDLPTDYTKKASISGDEWFEAALHGRRIGIKTWYYQKFQTDSGLIEQNNEAACEGCKM